MEVVSVTVAVLSAPGAAPSAVLHSQAAAVQPSALGARPARNTEWREIATLQAAGTVVWFRATAEGTVLVYGAPGYRNAFARPVEITADEADQWKGIAQHLLADSGQAGHAESLLADTAGVRTELASGELVLTARGRADPPALIVALGGLREGAVSANFFADALRLLVPTLQSAATEAREMHAMRGADSLRAVLADANRRVKPAAVVTASEPRPPAAPPPAPVSSKDSTVVAAGAPVVRSAPVAPVAPGAPLAPVASVAPVAPVVPVASAAPTAPATPAATVVAELPVVDSAIPTLVAAPVPSSIVALPLSIARASPIAAAAPLPRWPIPSLSERTAPRGPTPVLPQHSARSSASTAVEPSGRGASRPAGRAVAAEPTVPVVSPVNASPKTQPSPASVSRAAPATPPIVVATVKASTQPLLVHSTAAPPTLPAAAPVAAPVVARPAGPVPATGTSAAAPATGAVTAGGTPTPAASTAGTPPAAAGSPARAVVTATASSQPADSAAGDEGRLPQAVVDAVVQRREPALMACYSAHGRSNGSSVSGRVTVRLSLSDSGEVMRAVVANRSWPESAAADLESCILHRVLVWRFPGAQRGSTREFTVKFGAGS